MSGLKKITILLMGLFVLLCIYWAVGRNVMVKSISGKIESMQSEGYKVVHKGLSVGGFPLKFRASLSDPNIDSPRSLEKPWSIKANDWRMEALSIHPFKWTGSHRGEARIDMRGPKGERWLFDARPFNIDVTAKATMKGEMKALGINAVKLNTQAVIGTLPPIVAIDQAKIKMSPVSGDMRIDLALENIFLEKETLADFQKIFGPRIEKISATASAKGLSALTQEAVETWKKTGQLLSEDLVITWDENIFFGRFDLSFTERGASGVIRVEVEDINLLISRLEAANILTPTQARQASLASIMLPVGQNGRQEITLTLRDGYLTLFGQKIFEL